MKPYGAREPRTRFIECYCLLCYFARTTHIKKKLRKPFKKRERRRGKKETQNRE
jgi:hypothetical protein